MTITDEMVERGAEELMKRRWLLADVYSGREIKDMIRAALEAALSGAKDD